MQSGERAADRRVSSKRDFLTWREDAELIAGFLMARGKQKGGFDQISPARERLHIGTGEVGTISDDTERIAATRAFREYVKLQIADSSQAKSSVKRAQSGDAAAS